MEFDGVIGNDFIAKFHAHLDYFGRTITLPLMSLYKKDLSIDAAASLTNQNVLDKVLQIVPPLAKTKQSHMMSAIIPARSEKLISIKTDRNSDCLILGTEIQHQVYLGSSLSSSVDNSILVTILNANDKDVTVDAEHICNHVHNIDDYEIFNLDNTEVSPTNVDPNRLENLENSLKLDHLNEEERSSILTICRNYHDIFHLPSDTLTVTTATTHKIPMLPDSGIVFKKQYSRPRWEWEIINDHVDQLMRDNRIVPSSSPYNSPVLVVPRKGPKRWRVVVDFRSLNLQTVGDAYPLPNIDDILQQLGNTNYFSVIDMAEGFNQVSMDPEDAQKTAFTSPFGHHEFRVMPFGLKGAPARFQRLMDHVLLGLQGIKCFVYVDDLVLYAQTLEEHNSKLIEIFDRFRLHNLKIQTDKCEFLKDEIVYLGHTITKEGVSPNPGKIQAVIDYPVPTTTKQVKQFVALCSYYRKFVLNFSEIAAPLNELLKKDVKFHWTPFHAESFEELKRRLTSAPVLVHPDYTQDFILTTDASDNAIGGVLSQGKIGEDRPIAYASRRLNPAEKRYPTIDKELLAVVAMCKHFRHFLYGRRFIIYTDHRPLVWLFNVKDLNSRLTKFRLKLEEYDYEIRYKPGKQNTNADALSRIPYSDAEAIVNHCQKFLFMQTRSATRAEQAQKELFNSLVQDETLETREVSDNKSETTDDESEITDDESELTDDQPNVITPCNDSPLVDEYLFETRTFLETQNKSYADFLNFQPDNPKYIYDDPSIFQVQSKDDYSVLIVQHPEMIHATFLVKNKIKPDFFTNLKTGNIKHVSNNLAIMYAQIEPNEIGFYQLAQIRQNFDTQTHSNLTLGIFDQRPEVKVFIKQVLLYFFDRIDIKITLFTHNIIEIKSKFDIVDIIKEFHESPLGGHQGMNRTISRIKLYYYWPGMAKDVGQFIQSCPSCQRNKVSKINKVPMKITTTASKPFEQIFLDIVGPLPLSIQQNRYILTFQDNLTKFSGAIPLANQEAETIAEHFVTEIVCRFGIPQSIATDQGQNFLAECFAHVCKLLRAHKIKTSPYRPQSNPVERIHRGLAEYLRHFIDKDKYDWCSWLPYAMFVYNTTPHTSTNYTPFELLFGYVADLPSTLRNKPDLCYNYDTYANIMKTKFQHTHEIARKNILQNKEKSKKTYDINSSPVIFEVGEQVLLRNEKRTNKFSEIWEGPYEVLEILSPENTIIKIKNKRKTIHNNRLKNFIQ